MMYTKTINGRQVFSTCKAIELNGRWISNPTAEQIAEAGWTEYTPPPVVPQPQTEPDYIQVMEAVKRMLASDTEQLTDEEALEVAAMFPTWHSKIGEQVSTGERLWYDGKLYKVIQPHTPQSDWTPDTAVSLFVEVSIAAIPAWAQPVGSADAYQMGDQVTHNGSTWESLINNNVWEPGAVGTENLWTQI